MSVKAQVKGLSGPRSRQTGGASAVSSRQGANGIAGFPRLSWNQRWHLGLLLVAITFAACLPALQGQLYLMDDNAYVADNLLLRSLPGLWQIWFVPAASPQYYPLTFTSFWVDYHLWELNPLGYHLVNVLLQALNAILLWTILRRLEVKAAWLAAAIFALHPVNVESVAWVTERKNLLSGFFYLGSALACLKFWLPNPATADGRATSGSETSAIGLGEWKFFWLALVLYLCALLAKTAAIALPAAILLVVWWKRGKVGWRVLFPLAPFLAVGMAMGLLTVWIEIHHVHAVGREWAFSFVGRCLIASRAVWFYLGKLVWPHPLIFIYPRWEINASQPLAWLPVVALTVVLFILWRDRHGWARPVLLAFAYFLVLLFPVLGFFNVYFFRYSFVADHFQYLAAIGPLTLAAAGIGRLSGFFKKQQPVLCALLLLLLLGVLSWRQSGLYANPESLWRNTIRLNPDCAMAYNNLGIALLHQGRLDEAMTLFQKALKIQPDNVEAYCNLGMVFDQKGRLDEAIAQFRKAMELQPRSVLVQNNFGNLLSRMGRVDEAMAYYRQVLEVDSNSTVALNNLAWLLATASDPRWRNGGEAVRLAERACQLTQYQEAFMIGTLAAAYAEAGRFNDAVTIAQKARSVALTHGEEEIAASNEKLLELYQSGRAWHQEARSVHEQLLQLNQSDRPNHQ